MPAPHDHQPLQDLPDSPTQTASAIVDTTLDRAQITMLHPHRVVIVGSGRCLRIDHEGVGFHELSHVRLVVSPPPEAATDAELQRTLARWAGEATALQAHEVAHIAEDVTRTVRLTDPHYVHADLSLPGADVAR